MAKSKPTPSRGLDLVREGLLLGALAGQVLLLVALVTYGHDEAAHVERVGVVGHALARAVYGAFGVVSYVLLVLGLYTTVVAFVRKAISAPVSRLVGALLLLIGSCTLLFQFWDFGAGHAGDGRLAGGVLGEVTFDLMRRPFGGIGTFVIAAAIMCTGFAFATDWLLYEMLYDGSRRATEFAAVLKRVWPEPALAGPKSAPKASSARKAPKNAPGRNSAKAGQTGGAGETATALLEPELIDPELAELLDDVPAPDIEEDAAPRGRSSRKSAKDDAAPRTAADTGSIGLDDPQILVPTGLLDGLAPLPAAHQSESAPQLVPSPTAEDDAQNDDAEPDDDGSGASGMELAAFVPGPFETSLEADSDLDDDVADGDVADGDVAEVESDDSFPHLDDQTRRPAAMDDDEELDGPAEVRFERPRGTDEYELPSPQLLDHARPRNQARLDKAIQQNAEVLQRTLTEFKVEGRVVAFQQGPVVTMLEVALSPGTKVTKIHSLADDLAMALKAESVRIVAPIPGKSTVGVEIPNPEREDVRLPQLLGDMNSAAKSMAIPLFLGVAADGGPIVPDLADMPHLLLAGATGAGKSVCINTVLMSILLSRTPDEVKLILVDPKQVELSFFTNVPHLLAPVVTDMKRASPVLEWAVDKMEERYDLLRRFEVRNIKAYNDLGETAIRERATELGAEDEVIPIRLPYIVIVVDELADLMLTVGKDIERLITRLAQKSRAVGIHIILATQRPSTDVITGLIKANMPTRIAFKVTSKVDSRVILDQNGADKLLGMGDMLYLPPRCSALLRAQGTYVSDKEVKRVVTFLKQRYPQEFNQELVRIGSTSMLTEDEKDVLYDEAVKVVLHSQRGSASLLQRELGVGYTRASRLLDLMRKEGVVGVYKGSKASEVQMSLEEYERRKGASGNGGADSDD